MLLFSASVVPLFVNLIPVRSVEQVAMSLLTLNTCCSLDLSQHCVLRGSYRGGARTFSLSGDLRAVVRSTGMQSCGALLN